MDNINNEVINKCNKFGYYPIHILVENICKLFEKKQNNYVNSDNVNSDKINDFIMCIITNKNNWTLPIMFIKFN
mgnify:CR=1 FL=1